MAEPAFEGGMVAFARHVDYYAVQDTALVVRTADDDEVAVIRADRTTVEPEPRRRRYWLDVTAHSRRGNARLRVEYRHDDETALDSAIVHFDYHGDAHIGFVDGWDLEPYPEVPRP